MNKEHFLTELKIHLKPLSPKKIDYILQTYADKFDKRTAEGEEEVFISKQLGNPRLLAEAILDEFGVTKKAQTYFSHDEWQELTDEDEFDYQERYAQSFDRPVNKRPSFFIRFCQVVGVLAFNAFFMIWMIFVALVLLFAFWLTALLLLASPIAGIFSFVASLGEFGIFQLFTSFLLCGLGILGILLLTPITKYTLRFIKYYIIWTFKTLRGRA